MFADEIPAKLDQSVVLKSLYFFALDEYFDAVVLTPACDIEQGKAELITSTALVSAWTLIAQLLKTDWKKENLVDDDGRAIARAALTNTKRKWLANQVKQLMRQQFPRYHWLGPLKDGSDPLIADFQILSCISIDEARSAERIGVLVSPFREQLPTRYAAYMGRIGTPDTPVRVQEEWIGQGIECLFPE